ncbi:MAG TPA: hypothetical protein VL443_14000 [Cyclobacteriaceae bacterium]|nr:hypothetical protein [Cyclobacteriaceae bacterium]
MPSSLLRYVIPPMLNVNSGEVPALVVLNNAGFIFRTDSIGDNLEIVHHFTKEIDGENKKLVVQ